MKILLIEPYFTGSHAAWAEGYAHHSQHQVEILRLPGRFWKWRMHGGAVTLARQFLATYDPDNQPDLILATDMLDLTTFLALTRPQTAKLPVALYFHENQITYPWSPTDRDRVRKRDKHYGFINYTSALAAEAIFFNSPYHQESFLAELPNLLKHFPDYNELETVEQLRAKSQVLPLGLNLRRFDQFKPTDDQPKQTVPLLLWNHRWEYDKNPAEFFQALVALTEQDLAFELVILGKNFSQQPAEFVAARQQLADRLVHIGYVEAFATYAKWLWRADILPVTSKQDFFGASVAQAIYCDCFPLLPQRLAYPNLIPPASQPHCFYDEFNDLVKCLSTAIINIEQIRQVSLRHFVDRYDWSRMVARYDAQFEAVLSRSSL